MEGYFEIGKIIGTHGLKGTLKVFPTTDDPKRFELLEKAIINIAGVTNEYSIKKVAYHKNIVLLTLDNIDDINAAEKLKGGTIIVEQKNAIPLDEDEYYNRDLYDMEVFTVSGEYIGVLEQIYITGANDVYGVVKDGKEILIPAIKQCIIDVDVPNKKMVVKLMEGLV